MPFDRLGTVDGFAKDAWLDRHGQTGVADLTIAITSVASFGTAGPLSALRPRCRRRRTRRRRARRGATADEAVRATSRAHLREKYGAGIAGAPGGSTIGNLAAHLSLYPALRPAVQAELRHYRAQIAAAVAAGTLSRAVRKGLTDEAIARLKGLSGVP